MDEPGGGVDALAEALAALEGVWLPAGLWESVVLPARVVDYRPAMLDELIAAGEVVWQARPVGDAASRSGAARVRSGAEDVPAPGEIAFFPTDSALAPVAGEVIALAEPEAPAGRETGVTGEELWRLVREGTATGRSFEPVRRALVPAAGTRTAPPSRRVRSRRGRRLMMGMPGSGEVVWQARPVGDAASRSGAARVRRGAADVPAPGEIAFFPTDSALAPVAGEAIAPGEPEAPEGREAGVTGERLWQLVREGAATGRSFEPVRWALAPAAGTRTAPPSRRVRSRRGRRLMMEMPRAGEVTAAGRLSSVLGSTSWVRLSSASAGDEERAIAEVESLLDRYGVVSRDLALTFGGAGGLGPLMPVLRRMEETGVVLRGSFIEGLGPAQFAERESIERLRSLSHDPGGAAATPVVLDLKDPACLVGRGVPWPEPVLPAGLGESAGGHGEETSGPPVRRQGASVVVLGGAPVLYASENLKVLISYTSAREELARALTALAADRQRMFTRQGAAAVRRRTVVESLNRVTALEPTVSDLLRQAGFVRDPRGMRLAVGPYGATWR